MIRRVLAAAAIGVLACSAAPTAIPAAPAIHAAPAAPKVTYTADARVQADERLAWNIDCTIQNFGELGYYADSLLIDFTDGETRGGVRRWTENQTALLAVLEPVSGHDTRASTCVLPARFERGTLTLRLHGHTSEGALKPLTATVQLEPGPVSLACPPELLRVGERTVELMSLPPGNTEGHAPGVLLVHGEGEHARLWLGTALSLNLRGYGVVAVSLPGHGASTGPADLGGPATSVALDAAYEKLRQMPGVDATRLAVWGAGSGATAAALLTGRHADVSALVLQAGTFDLWSDYRAADARGRAAIVAEAGKDSAGWRARSPLSSATGLKCHVLLIHGETDEVSPTASARAYGAALSAAGATVDARFQPGRGHDISIQFARASVNQYLKKLFGQ